MADQASGRAVASLIFGILGLTGFAPCIGPVIAIVLGTGEPSGVGRAGVILGWITLVIYAAIALVALAIIVLGGGIAVFESSG